jgi:glucosylceramidase
MKHFSAFIRPGARRVELAGPFAGQSVAFDLDGTLTVLIRNPLNRTAAVELAVSGATIPITLKAHSINTLSLSL